MIATLQSVIKKISKVTLKKAPQKLVRYILVLMLSKERKNFASMARENNFSYKKVYISNEKVIDYTQECKKFLIETIKECSTEENPGYLLVDFTILSKQFSKNIPKVTYDYDGSKKQVTKGFSVGYIVWTNGKILIPINYSFWLRKKDIKDENEVYKTKIEITKELILAAKQAGIPFNEVRLDGAFATVEMFDFVKEQNLGITARIPSNRVIETKKGKNQLAKLEELKMEKNEKYKTTEGSYKGHELYFTAQKRNAPHDKKEIVFVVSNIIRTAKEHVNAYAKRWPVEKYFRTGKQHIGLAHCQSTHSDKQQFHLFSVMVTYAILQCIKYDKRKKSVEVIIHSIRRQKRLDYLAEYIDLEQTIMC